MTAEAVFCPSTSSVINQGRKAGDDSTKKAAFSDSRNSKKNDTSDSLAQVAIFTFCSARAFS